MARGFVGPHSWSSVKDTTVSSASSASYQAPRKRVTQACQQCRARKYKCDGGRPNCSTCKHRGKPCSYDPGTKKRGLPEGYVRDLENYKDGLEAYTRELEVAWGYLLRKRGVSTEGSILPDQDDIVWKDENFQKMLVGEDTMDDLQRVWRDSLIFQNMKYRHPVIESMEDKLTSQRGDLRNLFGNQHGRSLNQEIRPPCQAHAPIQNLEEGHSQPLNWPKESTAPASTHGEIIQFSETHIVENSTLSRLPANSWQLLKIYFAHSHSWFPIVDKNDLLRTMHQSSKNPQDAGSHNTSGSQALLWSVFAFAEVQCKRAESKIVSSNDELGFSTDDLYLYARNQIPTENGSFDIGHVQALLLLSLFNISLGRYQAGWLLVGQAVRLALQLGLNRCSPRSFQALNPRTTPLAHRAFLGCFVMDTLIAARMGRCPHLGLEDVAFIGDSVEENGLEEWEPWADCLGKHKHDVPPSFEPSLIFSTFNLLVKVFCNVNTFIRCNAKEGEKISELSRLVDGLRCINIGASDILRVSSGLKGKSKLLPHHLNYHVGYLSALATLQIAQCRSPDSAIAIKSYATDLRETVTQMLRLLAAYSEVYGLEIAPPIFEYFSLVLFEGGCVCDEYEILSDTALSSGQWKEKLLCFMQETASCSTDYTDIQQTLEQDCAPVISSANAPADGLLVPDEQVKSNKFQTDTLKLHGPDLSEDLHTADHDRISVKVSNITYTIRDNTVIPSWQHACWGQHPTSIPGASSDNLSDALGTIEGSGTALEPPGRNLIGSLESSVVRELSSIPEGSINLPSDLFPDQDALFAELSTMDVMQWTSNHDQNLLDLGFTTDAAPYMYFPGECEESES